MTTIATTIGALVEAQPALRKLAGMTLDAKSRYHVAKLLKLVSEETRDHFFTPQQDLYKTLGTTRPPTPEEIAQGRGEITTVPPEKLPELAAAIKDLIDVAVEVPWGPVTLAMVEAVPAFTAEDLLALGPLLMLDEPPKAAETQKV